MRKERKKKKRKALQKNMKIQSTLGNSGQMDQVSHILVHLHVNEKTYSKENYKFASIEFNLPN